MNLFKKMVQIAAPTPGHFGMSFIKIYAKKVDVFVCFDAAFATYRDDSSQLGVIEMILPVTAMLRILYP